MTLRCDVLQEPVHYDKTGVRVLTVCPGATKTELLTESPKRQMDNELGEQLSKKIETLIAQKPDNVANAMVHILNKGDSGSVWVSKNNEPPFLVSFPEVEI
uniref:Uncharacterized protein n=1 Tax=Timema douglasi TaxID=61478 RepID=A0A7R8VXT2_TIMDO|nr:unnamed protein product [Timema douglasi]